MKYIVAFTVALLFSGCLVTTVPPKVEYRINPSVKQQTYDAKMCQENSLKIAQAFSTKTFSTKKMNYVQGEFLENSYSASEWSITPNRAISEKFKTFIRDTKIFKTVESSKSRSRSDLILEVNIEDFIQYFDATSTQSHAKVEIGLTLIENRSKKVLASDVFTAKVDAKSLNAEGGVEALNLALAEVLYDSSLWLNKVCR
jgi:cholesterol transport system auxiliary component